MKPAASIINTALAASVTPAEELLDYATTRARAKRVATQGIRVNAVAPRPEWTPLQVAGGRLPGSR